MATPKQNSLKELLDTIQDWHSRALAQAGQLIEIPDGTTAVMKEDKESEEEKSITLTGDVRLGFMLGAVSVASLFDELPFVIIEEEVPSDVKPESEAIH